MPATVTPRRDIPPPLLDGRVPRACRHGLASMAGWAALAVALLLAVWSPWARAAGVQAAAEPAAPAASGAVAAVPPSGPHTASLCEELSRGAMPALPGARRALLELLDQHVQQCAADPRFLALLGGLWLEEGNAAQALLWLERALLLDPTLAGARADHALALAEIGEPQALEQLRLEWAARSDLPPLLRQRLAAADRRLALAPPVDASGRRLILAAPAVPRGARWRHRGELGLLFGHETNLDRSPTLDSLTLTSAGSPPVELPLIEPLRPTAGAAWMPEASWRSAWDSGQGTLLQAAATLAARHAPSHPDTDWHFGQLTLDAWRQWGAWRVQALAQTARSGGDLNEPYTLRRLGLAAEADRGRCTLRLALDEEQRRQSLSSYADADARLWSLGVFCEAPGPTLARWSLTARAGTDRARDPTRPGGDQRLSGLTARYSQPLGTWTLEASLRMQRTRDEDGYSPLLADNSPRHSRQWAGGLELTHPIPALAPAGGLAQGVLQWQSSRLRSNIVVFEHQSTTLYSGLRLQW